MIKIIRNGPKTFPVVCRHCGTKFEYGLEDISVIFGTGVYQVICPECGNSVKHFIDNPEFFKKLEEE